jgi:hypothetical protein
MALYSGWVQSWRCSSIQPVVESSMGRAMCSDVLEGAASGARSARRANRFEVANCAHVRVAMGMLS